MKARSSASTPPVSANTVCTFQPRSCSHGTQKLVSSPPENARTMSVEEPGPGTGAAGSGESGCCDMGTPEGGRRGGKEARDGGPGTRDPESGSRGQGKQAVWR